MINTGLLRDAINEKHQEALRALAVVESYLVAVTPGLEPKPAEPEVKPIVEPPVVVRFHGESNGHTKEGVHQVEQADPEPIAPAKPVLKQIVKRDPPAPSFKQRIAEWMKGKGPQFIADIAHFTSLDEMQVYASLMNNKKDFKKIGMGVAMSSAWQIASEAPVVTFVEMPKAPPVVVPPPAADPDPVPEPAEPKPAAPTEVPDLLKTAAVATEETDDEARDRVYKCVAVYGNVRPVVIAQSLNMTLLRVQQLLNHDWFQKDLAGYSIARRAAE